MKKFVVALVCAAGLGLIAYPSLKKNTNSKRTTEKKADKQEKKKECSHSCMYSYS
jgi:hypothetical protein